LSERLGRLIVRNTLATAGGRAWGILLGLILTPYIVHHIGVARFGIFVLVNAVIGYLALFDLGISSGFVKHLAEFHANERRAEINQLLATGVGFYAVSGVVVLAIGMPLAGPIVGWFRIDPTLVDEALFAFRLGLLGFALGNVGAVFSTVPIGLQRMTLANAVGIAISLVHAGGTVTAIGLGWGLRGLVVNSVVVVTLSGLFWLFASNRLLPGLELRRRHMRPVMLRRLFHYGVKLQVARIADLVSFQFDKLLLARVLGLDAVANYQVGSRVVDLGRNVAQFVIPAVVPAASELDARAQSTRVRALYERATRWLLLAGLPLMVFLFVHADGVVRAWMGDGFAFAPLTVRVLAVGYLLNLLTAPAAAVGAGIGRPDIQMKAWIWMAAANIPLSIGLFRLYGYPGVLVGTSAALGTAHAFDLALFHRHLRMPIGAFLARVWWGPGLAAAAAGSAAIAALYVAGVAWATYSRWEALARLAASGLVFSVVYVIVLLRCGYLDATDRSLLPMWRRRPVAAP
jgi:O-antigen/teichoic acid export membrane protein